ncbi:hypothetical protein [Nostoc sp.]|uniref:hypothetical protein n=1 Tax=Nostoc sp. TaxID=1180 RepID=UPI002FF9E2F9
MDLNKYKIVCHCILQKITCSPWSLPEEEYEVFASWSYRVAIAKIEIATLQDATRSKIPVGVHSTAFGTLREGLRQRNDILYLISPSYLLNQFDRKHH